MNKTFLWIMTLVFCGGLLSACGALLVGGAGAGGYYVGKDERTVGVIASDAQITSSVNAKYVRDDLVSALDIDVDTYRGVVTLNGHVHSSRVAQRAVQLAGSVKGVSKVISKLTVVDH